MTRYDVSRLVILGMLFTRAMRKRRENPGGDYELEKGHAGIEMLLVAGNHDRGRADWRRRWDSGEEEGLRLGPWVLRIIRPMRLMDTCSAGICIPR